MATVYIHWPFCVAKCAYCNFNSYVANVDTRDWLSRYKKIFASFPKSKISSVYFGGGTPSLLPPYFIKELLAEIDIVENAEITLEINPKTVDYTKLTQFKKSGINRVSVGVQSIYDDQLKLLGRISHSAQDSINCVKDCSKIFDNISVDFIYNRPFQTVTKWKNELLHAMEIFASYVQHVSCYELILEPETPLAKSVENGFLPRPKLDDAFINITKDILAEFDFKMYEISNYAKNGKYSQHNLSYWNYEDYYGIGPGAHSRVSNGTKKIAIMQDNSIENFSFAETELTAQEILEEMLLMGLRTIFGVSDKLIELDKIQRLVQENYAIHKNNKLILTFEGLKRLNAILLYLFK